jgi:hypothetical protein
MNGPIAAAGNFVKRGVGKTTAGQARVHGAHTKRQDAAVAPSRFLNLPDLLAENVDLSSCVHVYLDVMGCLFFFCSLQSAWMSRRITTSKEVSMNDMSPEFDEEYTPEMQRADERAAPMLRIADERFMALPRVPTNGISIAIVVEAPTGIVYNWADTRDISIQWMELEGFLVPAYCYVDIADAKTVTQLIDTVAYHAGAGFDTHVPTLDLTRSSRYGCLAVRTTYGAGWLVWHGDHRDLGTIERPLDWNPAL